MKNIAIYLMIPMLTLVGCTSPRAWRRQADDAAARTISEFQEKALGSEKDFTIEQPSDVLRKRLMIDQNLPTYTNRSAIVFTEAEAPVLDGVGALQVAARNSKSYQDQKEEVFRAALDLDLERDEYRNSWSGILSALFSSDQTGDATENTISGGFTSQLSRNLKTGGTIAGKLGVDVIKLLTLDKSSSYGLLADATATIPLMRGAGKAIVTEPLTQAERNLMYALWRFERFRKTFAVQIASEYFAVLQSDDELRNAIDSVKRLEINLERSQELAQAGRLPELQVDQTRQDLLRARTRMVTARQSSARQLDSFKQTLGLPVDATIRLDGGELEDSTDLNPDGETKVPNEQFLIETALARRLDLRIVYEQVDDAVRQLAVARDALRAGLQFKASASNQERRYEGTDTANMNFEDGNYRLGLDLDPPWERTAERNAYRLQIISRAKARRALEEKEDQVKSDVRNSIRSLEQARQNYIIQLEALKLAQTRIESTQLFLDAGRANTRDVLEAEDALISAKNAVTAAFVSYRVSRLELMSDTGTLDLAEEWGLDI